MGLLSKASASIFVLMIIPAVSLGYIFYQQCYTLPPLTQFVPNNTWVPHIPQQQIAQLSEADFDVVSDRRVVTNTPLPSNIAGLDAAVSSIFRQDCARCHKNGKSQPGVQLFTDNGNLFKLQDKTAEQQRRQLVYNSVQHTGESKMPKNEQKLSQEKLDVIEKWAKEI